ncbi:MAG: hypothetical protein ABEN55_19125, partial [Bradymonadaceae bacterium]
MGPTHTRYLAATAVVGAAILVLATGCAEEYDFERKDYQRESLGDVLHGVWLKDAKRAPEHSEAKTALLKREEADFVRAVNTLAPTDQLREVDLYLRKSIPSTRSGLVPSLTRKLRNSLQMATRDEALLRAMVPDRRRLPVDAYVSPDIRPNLPHYLLQYGDIRGVSTTMVDAMLGADGVDAHGRSASRESTEFRRAQRLLATSLASTESSSDEAGSASAMSLEAILLTEDGRFQVDGRQTSLPAVRYDKRGYPRVRLSSDGTPIALFVDQNGDGLADVDNQGQFLLEGGQSAEQIRPFTRDGSLEAFERDALGRAKTSGEFVFDYLDLAHTGADFLIRQTARLHEREVLWKLADGLPALLGVRTTHSDDHGEYRGYAAEQPLTDLLEAAGLAVPGLTADTRESLEALFALDNLPGIARMLARLIDTTGPETAELIDAIRSVQTTIDQHPDAQLADNSTIGYDLLPILEEIAANRQLWTDVLASMREPIFARFGEPLATMFRYADKTTVPSANGAYESCFQQCKTTYESRATDKHPHGIGTVGRYECIQQCPTDELFSR